MASVPHQGPESAAGTPGGPGRQGLPLGRSGFRSLKQMPFSHCCLVSKELSLTGFLSWASSDFCIFTDQGLPT